MDEDWGWEYRIGKIDGIHSALEKHLGLAPIEIDAFQSPWILIMTLADYLAKNYLSAESKPDKKSKKRKRKDEAGLIIADDDVLGWDKNHVSKDDEDGPLTGKSLLLSRLPDDAFQRLADSTFYLVNNTNTAEFRRSKKSTWKTIGAAAPTFAEQAAADAILASAAAENAARNQESENAPTVDDSALALAGAKMESGAHAGLQSAEAVTAQLEARKREEKRRFLADGDEASGKGQETIYRDASGRIINVAMKRAEARRKAEEEERKRREEEEAAKGDVQRLEEERRREELREAKFMTVARGAGDEKLNEELREKERWDDPMKGYLEKEKGKSAGKKSVSGKPLYKGAAAPNRYGIRPGYRWDGVDRGNGFEKEWFMARNRRENLRNLEYQWQIDV